MLQALGMKSTLITDGNSPINLFTTANGLIGNVVARRTGAKPGPDSDDE
jgi:major vault protein